MSSPKRHRGEWTELATTAAAERTVNPIRAIVDHIKPNPNLGLKPIPLSIGDPTLDGNLLPPANYNAALAAAAMSNTANGYAPAIGTPNARASVASYMQRFREDASPLSADDVVLTSGASQALEMAIAALCNPGDELLLPAPGFSLYNVICSNRGINVKYYKLLPEKNWACDLEHLETVVTAKTKAMLILNPSNPCGSNFERSHVEAILAVADRLKVPIIADEIYAGLVFDIHEKEGKPAPKFTSVAAVSTRVPCLVVGGIAKTFVVPGHRMGWVVRHDPLRVLDRVWTGVGKLATLIVGPNTIVQAALPALLHDTPASYHEELRCTLRDNARLCVDLLAGAEGVGTVEPQGAMYLMVSIDFSAFDPALGVTDDKSFASKLVQTKNVVVLPGSIFEAPGFIRIVFTKPADQLREAISRIVDFCRECRYKVKTNSIVESENRACFSTGFQNGLVVAAN